MDIRTLHSRWSFIVPNISICQYSHISVSYEKYEHTIRNLDKHFILHENYENAISTNPKYLIFSLFFGINCFYNKNKSFIRCFVEYTVHFSGGMSPFMKGGNMHANKYFSKHQFTNTVFEIPPRQLIHSIKIAHLKNKTIYLIDLLGTNIDYKHRKRCTNLCVFVMNQLNVPLIYFLAANWFSVWMANAHGST